MINNEILSFIKSQLAEGATKDQVKNMLVAQGGWDEKDVEEAFETINFSGTSYPDLLKKAEALAVKPEENEKPAEAFPLMPELTKSLSGIASPASSETGAKVGGIHEPVFSPGLSHVEQPKSMEPSMPSSSSPAVDIAPPSTRATPPPVQAISENPRAGNTLGDNALGSLRARIASGVSQTPAPDFGKTAPASFPVTPAAKEPVASTFPKPSVVSPNNFSIPAVSPMPAAAAPKVVTSQPSPSLSPLFQGGMAQKSASPILSSLGNTPKPSVMSAPALPIQQPVAVFPKDPKMNVGTIGTVGTIGGSHISPTPAQLSVLRAQKQKGGRFLLGLLMFLIGLVIGGISMNAYMKGYINTSVLNGIVEKGMSMIGLGTVTAPPEISAPDKAPATPPALNEGS
jgi:hypothetical protein